MIRAGLLAAALLSGVTLGAQSGASFSHKTTSRVSAAADSLSNYARLWSQETDPTGLGGYALTRGAQPARPAATGADDGLTVDLGRWRNTSGVAARAFVVAAPASLPPGVDAVDVTLTVQADPGGRRPLAGGRLSPVDGAPGTSRATLVAGERVQVDLDVNTRGLPGELTYTPTVTITARYAGYDGAFLATTVPVQVADSR